MANTGDLCISCRDIDLLSAFYNRTSVYRDKSRHPALATLETLAKSAEVCMLCELIAEELLVLSPSSLSAQQSSTESSLEQDPSIKLQAYFEDDDEEEEEYVLLAMRRGHIAQFRLSTDIGRPSYGFQYCLLTILCADEGRVSRPYGC